MLNFNVPQECNAMSLPKVARVYAVPRQTFGDWYYTETATLQTGIISGNSGNSETPKQMFVGDTFQFTETYEEDAQRNYRQEISFDLYPTKYENRDILEMFKVERELLVFFEDGNGKIWVAGETKGMRVSRYSLSTETNSYEVQLVAQERSQIREIDADYFESLINPTCVEILCEATWDELCASTWDCLCSTETIWQDKILIGSWDATSDLDANAFRYLRTPANDEIEVFWGDGTSTVYPSGINNNTSIQHTYSAPAVYEISVKTTNLSKLFEISEFNTQGQVNTLTRNNYWKGVLDLRQLKKLESFVYYSRVDSGQVDTQQVTEIKIATDGTTNLDTFTITDLQSLEELDLSTANMLGGDIELKRAFTGAGLIKLNADKIHWPTSISASASEITNFEMQFGNDDTVDLDLSTLENLGGEIRIVRSVFNKVIYPKPRASAPNISVINNALNRCGTIDMSNLNNLGGILTFGAASNSGYLTQLIFPTSLRPGTLPITNLTCVAVSGNIPNLTGTLDLSALTTIDNCNINFSASNSVVGNKITTVVLPPTAGSLTNFEFFGNDLGYFSGITNFANSDGISVRLDSNSMTTTEVNFWLRDFDDTGWINGTIRIDGTNAAPDTTSGGVDGVAAAASLVSKGWTVTTS